MSGIDCGGGQTNIDHATGIRFGVIPHHDVLQAWADSAEGYYGEAQCPDCEGPVEDSADDKDYRCESCDKTFWGEEVYSEEALSWDLDNGEYKATQSGDDCDVFILRSPYYTRAQFCSPCAPGACYLLNPEEDGAKAYCFGHDWFETGKAPYPVYRVSDDTLVEE